MRIAVYGDVAVVSADEVVIGSVRDALDLMLTVQYDHSCTAVVVDKRNLDERFFDLKTGLAGEITQKFANYGVRLGIVGDFDGYSSQSLKAFIRESNRHNLVVFKSTEHEALEALSSGPGIT